MRKCTPSFFWCYVNTSPELQGELRPCQADESNKVNKEVQESGRADKAGHKLLEYSSDRLNDKLHKTGRGCGSGGVSVDDDAPQETGMKHGCTAEPSPTPRETTAAVLVEAAETPKLKTNTERPTDIEPAS